MESSGDLRFSITGILDPALLLLLLSSHLHYIFLLLFRDVHCVISLFWLIIYNRVSIWPPPQRAAASAIVHPDRPNRHEPDEWGRGRTSPFCCLGFRWVSAHSSKTMIWDQFLFAILFPQRKRGFRNWCGNVTGVNFTLSQVCEMINVQICLICVSRVRF